MTHAYPIPSSPPQYHSQPIATVKDPKRIYALLDSAFAGIGLGLTFWFAALLLLSGLTFSWTSVLLLAGFWLLLTYLALPRMHQIFTTVYLPDYFMARTKTGDGLLGDPVNLALLGSEEDIHAVMEGSGWVQADDITLRSSLGIVRSSITGQSYPSAPVSNLFLFGRKQDFAYQQEVDGNASQRHHVRFWRVPEGWRLQGESVQWLAAGTYDKSVGLSTMTLQITHKIDADVDAERDYIINSVRYLDPDSTVDVIEQFSTSFHDRNGGGDAVHTDGSMPILDVSGAATRLNYSSTRAPEAFEDMRIQDDLMNRELPPKAFTFVTVFLALQAFSAGLLLMSLFVSGAWQTPTTESSNDLSLAVGTLILTAIEAVLLILTVKRYKWARLSFLILVSIAAATQLFLFSQTPGEDTTSLLNAGTLVLLVLAFSAPSVRSWVFTPRRRGGIMPKGH